MKPGSAAASTGCLVLFLLPFAGVGVATAVQAVRLAAASDWGQAGLLAIFALVFGGVGIGGIIGAMLGRGKLEERATLESRHPDAPWLWRADWAAGRIEDSHRVTIWASWALAVLWNLISLPSGVLAVRAAIAEGKTIALLALLFPLVGAGLLVWAIRATIRYRRYGVSVLELHGTPGVVGRSLAGVVRTTSLLQPPDGFHVQLRSIRRVTRGAGRNRSTSERVLWEEERRVRGEPSRAARGMSTSIPFAFAIPRDAEPCDASDPGNRVIWRLRVAASVPGVDYESSFEVPVFRTAASDLPPTESEAAIVEPLLPAAYRQPPESKIQVSITRRGTEILFPAARNPGAAAGFTLFLAIWVGAIVVMITLGAPVLLWAVFVFFALLLLWGVLDMWLCVTRVAIDGRSVVLSRGCLIPSRDRRFQRSEITGVRAKIGMQAGGKAYYDLQLLRADKKPVTVGHNIPDKREAEWLAGILMAGLGMGRGPDSRV